MTGFFFGSYVILWAIVAVQFVAIFALYHHFGEMYLSSAEGRATQGPKFGAALKRWEAQDTNGSGVVLPSPGTPLLIVFASTKCRLCEKLLPELRRFAEQRGDIRPIVVCAGDLESVSRWAGRLEGVVSVVPDAQSRIGAAYGVRLLPYCLGVDRDGRVRAKGLVNDPEGLRLMVDETLSPALPAQVQDQGPVQLQKGLVR